MNEGKARGGRERGKLAKIDRAALTALWQRGVPSTRIAAAIGCSPSAIRAHAHKIGLPPRTAAKPDRTLIPEDLFRRMWAAGVCQADMARHFGYAHCAGVTTRRINLGLPKRGHSLRGKTITVAEFYEMELGRRMAEEHRREAA